MSDSTQSMQDQRLRPITSRQNARVKELRKLFHEAAPNAAGEIAVEGMHLLEEAIRSGLHIATVFAAQGAEERAHKLLPQLPKQTEVLVLPKEVFASAVPTETPQGIAALVRVKGHALADLLKPAPPLVVIAAGLQDPGNLGTIARSAEAFGATGLIVAENTVSPWNWKAVRASAGSVFRLPWVKAGIESVLSELKAAGVVVLATSSHKGVPASELDMRRPVAILIGNEGAGVPKNVMAKADELLLIPHSAKVESLNAGIAASVVLYEAGRQRQQQFTTEDTEGTEKRKAKD